MTTHELADHIYWYINSIQAQRNREHWDGWDDKREVEFIESLIRNNTNQPVRPSQHKPFKDEYGNSDWRDTGEMGG